MTRTESWEVADCMDSRSNNADSRIAKRRGFYVSLPVVFILVLLAVLIAVGVGLIVHFAGGKTNTNVICDACSAATTTSPTSKKVPSAAPTAAPITTIATPPTVLSYRLPTSVYPLHYDIELQPYIYDPDPQNFTFKGRVQILVRCNHPTKNITLHVEELNVDSSSIRITSATPSASGDPKYVSHEQETDRHFFIIKLDKNMQAGQNYSIQMNFSSPLWDGYFGMYYSKYKRNNQTVYLAVTQFEATNGRKAFPCFDEPAMKATFNITLVRREDYKSLSNMPIDNSDTKFQENGVNFVKDVYKQTPTMSTYILAFVVCDFLSIEKRTKNNVTIKTWAKPQSVNDTQYSLEDGVKITEYFEDYFDVKYPLEKQDMIAVPHFAGGAMENWGLIIYREQFMLNEDGVTTEEDKHKLAYTVAHELTHQWFGNLVTISWWSDIWLNEGFATYVGYMGLDHAHPSWRSFDLFIRLEKHVALSFDSQVTSHPVHVAVQTPEEIRNIFDNISYQKAASIIMMTRMFLGEETFKKGLTNYLKKLSYSNAASDDLFRELTEQAKSDGKDINVKDIMDTWILQMNYPVVTVSRDAHNTIQVSQKRFLSDPRVEDPGRYISPFNYSWTIPLTFTSSTDPWFGHNDTDVHWLYKHEPTKTFNISIKLPDNEDTDGWILANVQQYGFYRVNYKNSNWLALSRQLKRNHSVIPAANREQIINDAWSLARARHIQVDTALATVEYLDKERDYIPWSAALEGLDFLDSMLYNTTFHGAFQKFMQDKLTDPFNHFGLVHISRDHVDILSQVLIARKSCHYGIPTCQNEAIRQYNLWMNSAGHKPIDPNFRTNIYCNAIANGNETEWMFALQVMVSTEKRIQNDLHRQKFTLVKMYKNAERASEKVSLLSAMACSKLPDILNKYMKRTLEEDSPFSEVDSKRVVAAVALRHHGRRLAWNFIKENFGELTKTFSYFDFQKILSTCIGSFKTEEDIHEVEETGQKLGLPSEVVSPAVQVIRDNINWIQTNAPIITKWLKDRNYLTEQSPRL